MHEMSLCEGIRDAVESTARAHGVARVSLVRLEIGRFAGVEHNALEFAFEIVMRGSCAEGATLEIAELPGRAMCFDCASEVELPDRLSPCPTCGGGRLVPTAGDELRIKELEVA